MALLKRRIVTLDHIYSIHRRNSGFAASSEQARETVEGLLQWNARKGKGHLAPHDLHLLSCPHVVTSHVVPGVAE